MSKSVEDVIRTGLSEPATRHAAEFRVGAAAFAEPELFREFGIRNDAPSGEDVAIAVTRWLAARHNGCSAEWAAHRRRFSTDEDAITAWAQRYLVKDSNGERPVDRMRRAASKLGAPRMPSPAERDHLLSVARAAFPPGAVRYRFEVWSFAALRAIREILHYGRGTDHTEEWANVEIAADWMAAWPYGAGRIDDSAAYLTFRLEIAKAGLLVPIRQHRNDPMSPYPGVATTYRVPTPQIHAGTDLGFNLSDINRRIATQRVAGRPLSVDEAIHAIHVGKSGVDLSARYGPSTAQRLRALIRSLVPSLAFVA